MCAAFSGRILGVVEDTENGLQRYLRLDTLPVPVYSVARSPLKEAEDCLAGEAIVFSTEAILRDLGEILPGRQACVIGFGKIGAGIARALHGRHVRVVVIDTDPVRQAQAIALGYGRAATLTDALQAADLVFCATGNRALNAGNLLHLRDGAYVATVTSRDDELDLAGAGPLLHREDVAAGVVRYRHAEGHFHLLNDGNAVNFLHSSAIGPSIHLVKAEIIAALAHLMSEPHDPGLYEVSSQVRASIAAAWMDAFHTPAVTANA